MIGVVRDYSKPTTGNDHGNNQDILEAVHLIIIPVLLLL